MGDIKTDGVLDNKSVKEKIVKNALYVCSRIDEIVSNLKNYYKESGKSSEIASFAEYCDADGDDIPDKYEFSLDFEQVVEADPKRKYVSEGRIVVFPDTYPGGVARVVEGMGTILVNDEDRGEKADLKSGDVLRVAMVSPDGFGETKTVKIEISYMSQGKISGEFSVTTRSDEYFTLLFDPLVDCEIGSEQVSNSQRVILPPNVEKAAAKIVEGEGTILVNDEIRGSETYVENGDLVKIKIKVTWGSLTTRKTKIAITFLDDIRIEGSFSVKARSEYYCALLFDSISEADLDTEYVSNGQAVVLSERIEKAKVVLGYGKGSILVNDADEGSEADVKNGDIVKIKTRSPKRHDEKWGTTVSIKYGSATVGGGKFDVRTRRETYFKLDFDNVENAEPGKIYTSNSQTVILPDNIPSAQIYNVLGNGTILVNDVEVAENSTVKNGDLVKIRLRASESFNESQSMAIEIGYMGNVKVSGSYSIRTAEEKCTEIKFKNVANADLNRDYTSDPYTIVLPDNLAEAPMKISEGAGSILVNDQVRGSETTVRSGDVVRLQVTTGDEWGFSYSATVRITFSFSSYMKGLFSATTSPYGFSRATESAPFSARFGHSTLVFKDKLWVIGGHDSNGNDKNDVWYSEDGLLWKEATSSAAFPERFNHSSVVFDNKMWVIGGARARDGEYAYHRFRDVWYSEDGVNWDVATASAPFSWRQNHTSVVFDGKIWVIGGVGQSFFRDVWYSENGSHWVKSVNDTGFYAQRDHCSFVFDDKMWIVAAYPYEMSGNKYSTVGYSSDGVSWTEGTRTAPFLRRVGLSCLVFDKRMWVIGERDFYGYSSDVWYSKDGVNWVEFLSDPGFSGRRYFTTAVFKDRLWIIGGLNVNADKPLNDIWYSNKALFDLPFEKIEKAELNSTYLSKEIEIKLPEGTDSAEAKIQTESGIILVNGAKKGTETNIKDGDIVRLELKTGWKWNYRYSAALKVSYSDRSVSGEFVVETKNLVVCKDPGSQQFSGRDDHTSVVFKGKMWIIGGYDEKARNDVWSSTDGRTWEKVTESAEFSPRYGHSSVVFDEKMWVIGGESDGKKNDVWYSENGKTWILKSDSAPFYKRKHHVTLAFDNKLWVIGGDSGNKKNDVWYTEDGTTWIEATSAAGFSARSNHTAVVFDNRMWVIGGADGSMKNDVWHSEDGITWIEAKDSAAFSPRSGHSSAVYSGKMWVVGGVGQSDLWYSKNGMEWHEVKSENSFGNISNHTSLVFNGKLWIMGGYNGENRTNEIWYTEPESLQ